MDVGFRSPLIDFFKRGEVAKDVRLLAARGAMAPRAHEQVALLAMLTDDGDPEIRGAAEATIAAIPTDTLAAFLGRPDVPDGLRDFFRGRGVEPAVGGAASDDPLVDIEEIGSDRENVGVEEAAEEADGDAERQSTTQRLAMLGIGERMKVAMKGTKEERAVLIRDPNKLVSVSVLSSPKITDSEVENFAKMANVSEEILRIIGMNRAWTKNYGVIAALARNPKTPLGVSLHLVQRLNDRDLKSLVMDRNLQEPLKLAARKRIASPDKR
jgi:hypothetical protein